MAERGRYLYAIGRFDDPGGLGGVRGLGPGGVETVRHGGLVAVVGDVGLDEYGEEGLRRNLEDLAWLEQVARGHDAVVSAVAALGPTAPMRLATIFLDDDGVRARIDEWHDALHAALDRVEGRAEWSVKAYADPGGTGEAANSGDQGGPEAAPGDQGGPDAAPGHGAGAGLAYLQRKKDLAQRRARSQEEASAAADRVHAALGSLAVAGRRLAPQDPRLTGHTGQMVLNGAYLVEEADAEALRGLVETLRDEHPGLRLEVAGPWPPYSFATLEQQ